MTVPGVHSTPGEDVYVLLLDWQSAGALATFKVYVNPLINWVWAGGFTMILGTLVAAWSSAEGRAQSSYRLKTSPSGMQPNAGD